MYAFPLCKCSLAYAGFLAIAQLPVVFLFATKNSILSLLLGPGNGYEKLNYIHSGPVVVYFSVRLSMVPSGSEITSSTISPSWANKRKHLALPRSDFSVSSYFPHFDLFGSTSARSSFISSTCLCMRVPRDLLISWYCQRTDLRFVLHHNMLSYSVCAAMDLFSTGVLWPRFAYADVPLPRQGCLVGAYERHDYRMLPGSFALKFLLTDLFIDSHTRLRWRLGSRSARPASHRL